MERGASSDLFKGRGGTQECHALTRPSADVVPLNDKAITQQDRVLEFRGYMIDTVSDVEIRSSCSLDVDMHLVQERNLRFLS